MPLLVGTRSSSIAMENRAIIKMPNKEKNSLVVIVFYVQIRLWGKAES